VTGENQTYFDQRWKHLQNIPALIKFISYEPALEPLQLPKHGPLLDWLISGGESGGGARLLNPRWVRDIFQRVMMTTDKEKGCFLHQL
jgi:protein gp37